jgi:hypothetical protein
MQIDRAQQHSEHDPSIPSDLDALLNVIHSNIDTFLTILMPPAAKASRDRPHCLTCDLDDERCVMDI